MPEVGSCDAEPFARIGNIRNVIDTGTDYSFEFYFDPTVPAIPIEVIEEMAVEFGTSGFGLSNSHWSVKDFDIFEMLYRRMHRVVPAGHAFKIDRLPIKSKQIALMMPFDTKFNSVRDAIVSMAESIGCTCLRADNVWKEDVLIQDVINLIIESKLIICDVTDRNPNVFYEAGIAHALGKKVVLITQNQADVPFDLRHLRFLHYFGNTQGTLDLASTLRCRVEELVNS